MATKRLPEEANNLLRQENRKLRESVKELELTNRALSQSLAKREGRIAVAEQGAEEARRTSSALYAAIGVLADAVNGSTTSGRVAKDFARLTLKSRGLPLPSTLATRTPAKKTRKKKA
jgi:cell division septum initiation protein DivIVA